MVSRYREHELVLRARAQATSPEAWRDYRRRRHLMEGSFALSAKCHGCEHSRWRRLKRQQIQDWLIAPCQNVRIRATTNSLPARVASHKDVTGCLTRDVTRTGDLVVPSFLVASEDTCESLPQEATKLSASVG